MVSQLDSANKTEPGENEPVSDEKWELYARPDIWRLELDELDHYLYRVGNHAPIYVPATADSDLIPDLVALVERLLTEYGTHQHKTAHNERTAESKLALADQHRAQVDELTARHKREEAHDARLRTAVEAAQKAALLEQQLRTK